MCLIFLFILCLKVCLPLHLFSLPEFCTLCPCIHSRLPVLLSFLLPVCPVACLSSAPSYFPILMPFLSLMFPSVCPFAFVCQPATACPPAYLSFCVFLLLLCYPFPCPFVCLPAGLTWASYYLSASLSLRLPASGSLADTCDSRTCPVDN